MKPTKEQLEKINLFTRRELREDEVFVFTINLCDTNIDEDYERFSKESIYQLSEMLIGKSGVFDRENTKITARIFDIKVIETDEDDWYIDEDYARLVAYAYMVKSDSTKEIIKEIDAGIKKEVSIGCAVEKVICSICGRDMKCNSCNHKKGEQYAVHGFKGRKYATCHHILENPTDAYEWSFVAVPAQKIKGVDSIIIKCKRCGYSNSISKYYKPKYCSECGNCLLSEKEQLIMRLNREITKCKESWGMDIKDIESLITLLEDSRKYIKNSVDMF